MLSLAWLRDGPSMATRGAVKDHCSGHDVFDDYDRPLRRFARVEHLKKIEDANAKLLNRKRIGDA